ncbi:flagellar motor protein MotB [Novosphingobium resinovorum]|jgi:chemotaxis protein MotB|uniref:flagellar motor protein MotB n=1 Tax=Novosphingobium TaxID=165696 RepID=UPI001B3C9B95|nr:MULTISPECIES: flagellar motor protein MotB [Novosphingobium]MBF7012874.1 OmpA family protein [Novosphingobium sp. HR1a]WJM27611.1 flagellar motor protein MotB [Novosphingobium resinovorum]
MATKGNEKRPIVIRKVKKVVGGGHHGGAWKVAYADFVTAMMAFFMLLWLLANPDEVQLKGLAEYFSADSEKANPATTLTKDPGMQPGSGGHGRNNQGDKEEPEGQPASEAGTVGTARGGTAEVPAASLRVMAQEMQVALQPPMDSQGRANVDVRPSREGMRIHLVDNAQRSMFKGSTAQLNDFARALLTRAAKQLAGIDARIAIEGHTDGAGGNSDANWQLSADRALAARAALVAAGLPADRFAEVVGKAGTEPVYPDQPDRPENRRITIVVMAEAGALPHDASFKF